jgi:AsmA protein
MRWIVRIFATLFVFVLIAVAALFLIPSEKVAQLASQQFERATGRTMTITGHVSPSFWPNLGVTTGAVTIANAPWSDEGPMLTAEGLSIGVDAQALWGGAMRITGVEALSPVILLERNAAGQGNWEFGSPAGTTDATSAATSVASEFTLDKGTIRGGALTYIDHAAGNRYVLTDVDADLTLPAYVGPADVQLSATMNGQAFTTTASVATFGPALAGDVSALNMTAAAGTANMVFDGRVGLSPLMAEGATEANLGDLTAFAALLGMPKPDLPQGFGAEKIALTGDVTLTAEGTAHLRGGVVTLDGNQLSGDADFDPNGARPNLSAKVSAGLLNLSSISGGGGGGDTTAASLGWSKDTIDVSALGLMDATIALTAESIDLGDVILGPTQAILTIDRARAVFDLKQVSAYQGGVTGQFVVNGRDGLSMGGDLAIKGIALQPLLTAFADTDRLVGNADGRIKFLTSGNSVDAMMQNMAGDGQIALGKGELRGLDLAGMLRTMDPGFVGEGAKTIFDRMTASFSIKDGVLRSDDLALAAQLINVGGKGRVNLGKQTLNYRLVPTALTAADGTGGLKVPLDITGPWSDLSYKLDIEAMAGVDVDDELKARLAAEAKARLGVVARDGESLEDAAKRKAQRALEREAAKALEGLLGGN